MNNYYSFALIVLVFLLFEVNIGSSIECYNCRSETDPDCTGEAPDHKYLTNCSTLKEGPKYIACRKIENYVDFAVLGRSLIDIRKRIHYGRREHHPSTKENLSTG
ncbi:unnamed protein product, partial [Larinioides sclopetarius]